MPVSLFAYPAFFTTSMNGIPALGRRKIAGLSPGGRRQRLDGKIPQACGTDRYTGGIKRRA